MSQYDNDTDSLESQMPGGTPLAVDPLDEHTDTIADVKQLGMFAAIASLSYVFWVVGAMEMVERCAYYGVRAVAALYATASRQNGGLGVSELQLAPLFLAWALIQSLFPAFTGSLSDRYGYKETIFASTILKILGYIIMGMFPSFIGFFAGVAVLAFGTAVFKPGIQGTLVKCTSRRNSSIAWGIFYQTVNIGGWIGPLVASYLRSNFTWNHIFYVCAGIISLNFLLLLTYREVGREERISRARAARDAHGKPDNLFVDSIRELVKPHVAIYLIIFCGFWFMFNALFDVLPMHIRDWVDTRDITRTLFGGGGTPNRLLRFLVGANDDGTEINPEGMLNVNAGLIMTTCFLFAAFSARIRATTSMVIGTLFASFAMFMCGWATMGWISIVAIAIFSVGEMLSSPKFSEFIGNFAPRDKKAMYLGFSQIPLAIGWSLESYLGPTLYGLFAAKDHLARQFLMKQMGAGNAVTPTAGQFEAWSQVKDVSLSASELADAFAHDAQKFVDAIPQGVAFDWTTSVVARSPNIMNMLSDGGTLAADVAQQLATMPATTQAVADLATTMPATTQAVVEAATAQAPTAPSAIETFRPVADAITMHLHDAHHVGNLWYMMVAVGIASAIGIYLYGRWVLTLAKQPAEE
ncbi:MAG: MFS transporter [Phycisphaerae bacterium]|nr:MFS transporter [Phycisphaerae bacterium]